MLETKKLDVVRQKGSSHGNWIKSWLELPVLCQWPTSTQSAFLQFDYQLRHFHLRTSKFYNLLLHTNWYLFAYSRFTYSCFAYFRPKSVVSPTCKQNYIWTSKWRQTRSWSRLVLENVFEVTSWAITGFVCAKSCSSLVYLPVQVSDIRAGTVEADSSPQRALKVILRDQKT